MIRSVCYLCASLLLVGCETAQESNILEQDWLPTGVVLDPAGPTFEVGPLPLTMEKAPDSDLAVLLLSGWREQGVQVIRPSTGEIVQTLSQPAAFAGLTFSPDGQTIYASGGNQDVVYVYDWRNGGAVLNDSLVLASKLPDADGTRYPAGMALSPDGARLYVAENLADSLAVIDLETGAVVQRLATGLYPYAIVVDGQGVVYVSAWGGNHIAVFTPANDGRLVASERLPGGRHPSALLLSADTKRLFVASGSTDRIEVVDTESLEIVAALEDPAPEGPHEGSTPNAFVLSPDGSKLYVAEADNNAVAVFDLSPRTSGIASATGNDALVGRIPVGWYPTALAFFGDSLIVANGKGAGTAPNAEDGPRIGEPRIDSGYTLGQISGSITILADYTGANLSELTGRVARANGWDKELAGTAYPPFEHVLYVIKENRTYDQVFGDMPEGDSDSSLVYFPRSVSPNHHALADRFGLYDRFFVNAEVSPDGHNWSVGAYTTDYLQKTVPSVYSGRGRSYDYEGTNRGEVPEEDAAEPANGYLWDLAQRGGITFRNFGEFVIPEGVDEDDPMPAGYRGLKPFLEANTDPDFPGYDLSIPDQRRADVWIEALADYETAGQMPQLQIIRLPNDHTRGASAGALTPRAYMADNDLALGRIIEALSNSSFWATSIVFVVEDDSQNGPDHFDSHRAPFLAISPYNRPGVVHRFVNTTDVLATIEGILGLDALSQFDYFGRPLTEVYTRQPDLTPFTVYIPDTPLDETNPEDGTVALLSERLDFTFEDIADEDLFNRTLWLAIKGEDVPYPGIRRASMLDLNITP